MKRVAWISALLLACSLVVVATWHTELHAALESHRGPAFYTLLAAVLLVPGSLLTVAAGYVIELLFIGWQRSSLRMLFTSNASVRIDALAILVMTVLPHRRLGWVLSLGLLYAIDVYAAKHTNLSITHWLPWWGLQLVIVELLQSCARYWMHRIEHTVPALWSLHKFHHSAEQMSILTSERQTQLVQGVEMTMTLAPVLLLTGPTAPIPTPGNPAFVVLIVWIAYKTFVHVNGYLCHSNLRTGYGWIGRWLLVSPRMHRLHHAIDPAYHNKNFSFELVIWDRLFGTYAEQRPEDTQVLAVGLTDNPFNQHASMRGVLGDYFLKTYRICWQELKRGLDAWRPMPLSGINSAR